MADDHAGVIRIRGARQNNLKNLGLDLALHQLHVVTGVSGSGKSSLVFDTLYAEGQRRYVETFSPYARQFLDRMDKPQVDSIEGVPPAVAIDQVNPVRTSRSTVGTMTELNDHVKLLYARAAHLHCRVCGQPVRRDTAPGIVAEILRRAQAAQDPRLVITFPVEVPENFTPDEIQALLAQQGYDRIHLREGARLEVVQDRLRAVNSPPERLAEAVESALRVGRGRLAVHLEDAAPWRFSAQRHCADCDLPYPAPVPSAFSFNSPLGACEVCKGFGRIIGIDYGLVIPDPGRTLRQGAIKPWQTQSYRECQDELEKFATRRGLCLDTPWRELHEADRAWVMAGDGRWENGKWYGVRGFFAWLETKSYRMHIRVLLSRYRAYTECEACRGARLKPQALLWRLGSRSEAASALGSQPVFLPSGTQWTQAQVDVMPGLAIHDLMRLPLERARDFFRTLALPPPLDQAGALLLGEVRSRFDYLCEVGLGYLTLDRQSRTLSGGEVQRINLTTALGTSLVNTLFVLDEPSIGLHPRDVDRVVRVMQRLRDAGNTLVVVEHDPAVMLAADRILDLGPGPGERGGTVVYDGEPVGLASQAGSLTGDYLTGVRVVDTESNLLAPTAEGPWLEILGATEHNLRDIDVRIPLHRLVCITGVSGSGKSTLVGDVLYRGLLRAKGLPTEAPGAHRALEGVEAVGEVVRVDQSPIGRTTRSNPASYVGAFDVIRALFAGLPLARERGYKPGTFSFNAGDGRCPACSGNGFEHVEMQFLSDVYLRCPDCDGTRFRAEVREVRLPGPGHEPLSISGVLELTVAQAWDFFAAEPQVRARLAPLRDVGLEYLRLGQPVPTLSGGEAQRLKLAGHLVESAAGRSSAALFLFDEPTTGLHFDDIAKLLRAFRRLRDSGHSLLVIEHNLDVVAAADWIIDLGPEAGELGGQLVCAGTPAQVAAHAGSHTGAALRGHGGDRLAGMANRVGRAPATDGGDIVLRNAREHNLQDLSVSIPRERFTVITGVSGSGKSTLAFDILFAEGQRRYLESLNAYARQFVQPGSRPDLDSLTGLPPTVAIEQRTSRGGHKSTVATLTELYHFLRLLFVKLGVQYCPDCQVPIEPQTFDALAARILRDYRGQHVGLLAPLVVARKGLYTDLARWAAARGHTHLRVDGEFLPTRPWPRLDRFREHNIELPVASLRVDPAAEEVLREALGTALDLGKGQMQLLAPLDALEQAAGMAPPRPGTTAPALVGFSTKRACACCGRSFAELDPRLFSFNSRHGWCTACYGSGLALPAGKPEEGEEAQWGDDFDGPAQACPQCQGHRLNPVAQAVRFRGQSIAQVCGLTVAQAQVWLEGLRLEGREAEIARDILTEASARLTFLREVGLSYLALERSAPTLSGGEAQRIRLAAQLGSNLRGVCYILDEPTIGLHPRDNEVLLNMLVQLCSGGNTLVVVEHDEDTIRRAHHVIDLGPGAGRLGGRVVAAGTCAELEADPASITGRFLREPLRHSRKPRRAWSPEDPGLLLRGVNLHNLRGLQVRLPLGRLVCVTGVSGSGKSTFAHEVLHANLERALAARRGRSDQIPWVGLDGIDGVERLERVLEVDQTPIGKTPRSCPATYVGFYDLIRQVFADTAEARVRGYGPARFSFNSVGGRCEVCEGQGLRRVEMSFLPDVKVLCDACNGARFSAETLAATLRGRSIGDVLAMSVEEALEYFSAHPRLCRPLALLRDVGLGYLSLGQPSPTLSGGEAQRIKLVTELAKVGGPPRRGVQGGARGQTLYVLDEPTVGLHMGDVEKLIGVLHRLVDAGNSVVLIEHNLDVMAEADWIIDLGPEGGDGGGRIVAEGTPAQVARQAQRSHTGRVLAQFLSERGT